MRRARRHVVGPRTPQPEGLAVRSDSCKQYADAARFAVKTEVSRRKHISHWRFAIGAGHLEGALRRCVGVARPPRRQTQ